MKKYSEAGMFVSLLGIAIGILVAAAMIPVVGTTVSTATNNTAGFTGANVTGASNTLLGMTTLIFVAFVILVIYSFALG